MSRELLFSVTANDFRFDTFRASGPGGQHRNKTDSAVRATHIESGAVGQCVEHREQAKNKREAFKRCVESETFKKWHGRKSAEIMLKLQGRKSIEKQVDESMQDKNLKVEVQVNGKWIEESSLTNEER